MRQWVINVKKVRRVKGGIAEGKKKKWARGGYLSMWLHVAQFGGKGRRGSWLLNFTYLACVSDLRLCAYVSF